MNLVLTGFMGTGKSAVGRRVAERLKAPFVDLDAVIEKKAGVSVGKIFSEQGETVFRQLESQAVEEVASLDRTVIATGGGALLDAKNQERLMANGILICLSAKVGTLLDRLKDDVTRPLLAGENLEERLARLMKERQSIYAACPIQIATDGKTIPVVAAEILQHIAARWPA